MPTPTYDLIASNVLTSSASSVTFSSIPATYRDLVIVSDFQVSGGFPTFWATFNGDTGNNYNNVHMSGDGSTTTSTSSSNHPFVILAESNSSSSRSLVITSVFDYAVTDKHKSLLSRGNASATRVGANAGRWASTSAITSISLVVGSGQTMNSGSSFYLYGIVS